MRLLLNSFSLVLLLVGICAEMDDTSFEFNQFSSAAGRDLRLDDIWQRIELRLRNCEMKFVNASLRI